MVHPRPDALLPHPQHVGHSPHRHPLCHAGDKKVRVLEESKEIAARYAAAPRREFFTLKADNGSEMNAYVIKPRDFDPRAAIR